MDDEEKIIEEQAEKNSDEVLKEYYEEQGN